MALIEFSGFDHQIVNSIPQYMLSSQTSSNTYYDVSTDTRHNIGSSLLCNASVGWTHTLKQSANEVVVGLAFKGFNTTSDFEVLFGNSGYADAQTQIYFKEDGVIRVHLRNYSYAFLGGTTSIYYNQNWNYFEAKCCLNNTTGYVIIRMNGTVVLSLTDIDTIYSGTDEYIDWVNISPNDCYIDDLYLLDDTGLTNNDFLGDVIIDTIFPTANGNQNDGVASVGSNWECVDETAYNDDTDYVTLDAVNEIDLYVMGDLPSTSYTKIIYGVKVINRIKKAGSGSRLARSLVRTNSITYETSGDAFNPSFGYEWMHGIWDVNPNDSQVWEEADINALEAGIKVTA